MPTLKTQTLGPKPQTLAPRVKALHPVPYTLHPGHEPGPCDQPDREPHILGTSQGHATSRMGSPTSAKGTGWFP